MHHDASRPLTSEPTRAPFPVIGLGASAGGLPALQQFFDAMPPDNGMAFVVILHLSPEHESHAAAILQRSTTMPVRQVTRPVRLAPEMVFIIPPGKHLVMEGGMLLLTEVERPDGPRVAIDLFFRSLAESQGPRAAAVVLSGSGADGASGVKRVKERGGLVLAQDPSEAEHDMMPRHAIATGLVDIVQPVAELPAALVAYWQQDRDVPPPISPPISERDEAALRDLLAILRTCTGHDFSQYKRPTLLRRIARRMQVTGATTLSAYLALIRARPEEGPALLRDLLISVTNFFRDPPAWQALQAAIPRLFQGKGAGDVVRAWVAGCATGEEAYTLAILLSEHAATLDPPIGIQLFATDIDERAIAVARSGVYPETIALDVSPERLQRFFTREPSYYRVRKEIRDLVLFAPHNLLRDPPFSRLDLITCRNLLIYIDGAMQEQVLKLFHFTLVPDGLLLLGSSESTDGVPNLFTPLDKSQRLFQSRTVPSAARSVPELPLASPLRSQALRGAHGGSLSGPSFDELAAQGLTQYGPPSVIVNQDDDIIHLARGAGHFLQFADGTPSSNLLKALHPDLRLELRTALYRARQEGQRTETRWVRLQLGPTVRQISASVQPLAEPAWASSYALIFLYDLPDGSDGALGGPSDAEPLVRQLEEELQRTREQLRTITEQYETALEEHRAGNEELPAINEELRATSEELETSREELQSSNIESVEDYAIIAFTPDNRVASWNVGAQRIFGYDAAEIVGQDGALLFTPEDRAVDVPAQELTSAAERGRAEDERWHLRKDGSRFYASGVMTPLRDTTTRGFVKVMRDLTERKQAEDTLRTSEARFRTVTDAVPQVIWANEADGRATYFNQRWYAYSGLSEQQSVGLGWQVIVHPDDGPTSIRRWQQALAAGEVFEVEYRLRRADGAYRWHLGRNVPLHDEGGQVIGWFGSATDIEELKQAEAARRESAVLRQLAAAQEDERLRIARDLHDQLGQQITGLLLGLKQLEQPAAGTPLASLLPPLQELADNLARDAHRLAVNLRPTALDDIGLAPALERLVAGWSAETAIPAAFESLGQGRLPQPVETALFRVAQEALTNVRKHAQATYVGVIVERRDDQVVLVVEDNGRGFEVDTLPPDRERAQLGLLGMRERAGQVGGRLEIESSPGGGTTVLLRIPLDPHPDGQ